VKIKKPEDEKYFKDIVLKDILEEISNEGEGTADNTVHKKKASRKKLSTKSLLFLAISILLVLFTIVLFRLVDDATTQITPVPQIPVVPTAQDDAEAWKMEEDRSDSKKTTASKVVKATFIPKKEVIPKPIKIKSVKKKPLPKKKTERELAKEALRQQMLN